MCLYDFLWKSFPCAKIAHCPDIHKDVGRKIFGAADPSFARCCSCGNLTKTKQSQSSQTWMIEIALLACAVCRARERLKRKSLKKVLSFIRIVSAWPRGNLYISAALKFALYIFRNLLLHSRTKDWAFSCCPPLGGGYSLDYSHYHFPFSLIIALSPLTTLLKLEIFFEGKTNNLGEVCPLIIFLPSRHLVEHFLCLVWMQLEPLIYPLAILLVPLKDW